MFEYIGDEVPEITRPFLLKLVTEHELTVDKHLILMGRKQARELRRMMTSELSTPLWAHPGPRGYNLWVLGRAVLPTTLESYLGVASREDNGDIINETVHYFHYEDKLNPVPYKRLKHKLISTQAREIIRC